MDQHKILTKLDQQIGRFPVQSLTDSENMDRKGEQKEKSARFRYIPYFP